MKAFIQHFLFLKFITINAQFKSHLHYVSIFRSCNALQIYLLRLFAWLSYIKSHKYPVYFLIL